MGNIEYEKRRALKHGLTLEEWLRLKTERQVPVTAPVRFVYHHTNILFTHLIWSSGIIDLEADQTRIVRHPFLGEFGLGGAAYRRKTEDFPRVAWFSGNRTVPRCLEDIEVLGEASKHISPEMFASCKLNRIAIQIDLQTAPEIVPWQQHYGYDTPEGRELNRNARDVGDNPDEWYVSETPVAVEKMTAILYATNWLDPTYDSRVDLEGTKFNSRNARKLKVQLPPDWEMPSWQQHYGKYIRQITGA